MKLLIELSKVPLGEKVVEKTGSKKYIVRDSIEVYTGAFAAPTNNRKEIRALAGSRFLIDPETGDANAIGENTEVIYEVDPEDLVYMINNGEIC